MVGKGLQTGLAGYVSISRQCRDWISRNFETVNHVTDRVSVIIYLFTNNLVPVSFGLLSVSPICLSSSEPFSVTPCPFSTVTSIPGPTKTQFLLFFFSYESLVDDIK